MLFHFTDDEIEILEMQSQNHSPDQVRISLCFAKIYIVHSMSKPKVIVLKTKKGILKNEFNYVRKTWVEEEEKH